MKPSSLKSFLIHRIDRQLNGEPAGRPVMVWGGPGGGKSALGFQVAEHFKKQLGDFGFIDFRALLHDPIEIKGLPKVEGDLTVWTKPGMFPTEGRGLIIVDELPSAVPMMQAALYQFILDRKLGNYTLPPGWYVMGAGNRESDKAVVHRMPSPLANRFQHIQFEVDLDDWFAYGLQNDFHEDVLAFNRFKGGASLYDFDPKRDTDDFIDGKAFATPRAWEFVSDTIKENQDPIIEMELVQGTIGKGQTGEFFAFRKLRKNLPDMDQVLLDPANAPVPDEPDILIALTVALATRATEQTMPAIVTYSSRISGEFSVALMKDVLKKDNMLVHTKAYQEWSIENREVML